MSIDEPSSKRLRLISPTKSCASTQHNIFDGMSMYMVAQGLGKTRLAVFSKQLQKNGAKVSSTFTDEITHVIAHSSVRKEIILKFLKVTDLPVGVSFLDAEWVSQSLVRGSIVDESSYELFKSKEVNVFKPAENTRESTETAKDLMVDAVEHRSNFGISSVYSKLSRNDPDSDSSFEDSFPNEQISAVSPEKLPGNWICSKSSTKCKYNFNEDIVEKLEALGKTYTSTQDKWRALGYKKAVQSIKNYPKPIQTYEEVLQIPFVGERLAKKIWEIIETGHLRRLDHIDPKLDVINLFAAVWGAGPKTAEQWYAQGFRTLQDVQEKANLTSQQLIGLKYYHDILEKLPRQEVEEIGNIVTSEAEKLCSGIQVVVCGSYRRGRSLCGDIDILVSHPDGRSHKGFLQKLLFRLREIELVTDDLINVENGEQRKYMGVCRLKGDGRKYRRIDFIVAPYNEWPLALLHFTGSAHLNRSMRLMAKKKNMSLSEHALRSDVLRQDGVKVNSGVIVPVFSEEDVFRHLGLDFLQPTERDW